ncbi:MAG: 2OG-Fe(II) oxygenase [Pseudomonadota bacterium]
MTLGPVEQIIDSARHPLGEAAFQEMCKAALDREGVLVLKDFLRPKALADIQEEAWDGEAEAYFCVQNHSVYLTPDNPEFDATHAANRQVVSSKGCICDDQIPRESGLRVLYSAGVFRDFVRAVTGEAGLYPYADPLSSINIHYAKRGQELGWHFDNSSFAITLLIQAPKAGGRFEYVKDLRDAEAGEMNYPGVKTLLDGNMMPAVLDIDPGSLVFFRGRNSIHRVTPNESDQTRMLAVLAFNAEPGVALSEHARMTFYGRLGE